MLDWSYRLSDFLLFSPRVYWRMFELHNQALWPLPLATLALGIAALACAILRPRQSGRTVAILLAIAWAWVGWSFVWERYATINWTAAYAAPLFALEALLLVIVGLNRLAFEPRGVRGVGGVLLVALALGYPLLAPLFGRPWQGAEFFGIAPRSDRDRHARFPAHGTRQVRPSALSDPAALVPRERPHLVGDGRCPGLGTGARGGDPAACQCFAKARPTSRID